MKPQKAPAARRSVSFNTSAATESIWKRSARFAPGGAASFSLTPFRASARFRLDVRRARISALAADGHKWLLGPEGCGVLYIQSDLQNEIEPAEFGWTNVAKYYDYASRDLALRPDAGRYECGTLNTIGCFGLRAAIELVLEAGIQNIATGSAVIGRSDLGRSASPGI